MSATATRITIVAPPMMTSRGATTALWSHLDQRARAAMAAHIVLLVTVGLWLESQFGHAGQHMTNVWAITLLLWCACEGRREERLALLFATAISAIGEVTMSMGVGLYEYRYHVVPLFVPPGHALIMTLGVLIDRRIARHGRVVIAVVAALALAWAAHAWSTDIDRFGVLLCAPFAYVLWRGPARSLYAVMFLLALSLELYGTANNAWTWSRSVPYLNVSAANPPFAAGAFYCALDLVVLGILRRAVTRRRPAYGGAYTPQQAAPGQC